MANVAKGVAIAVGDASVGSFVTLNDEGSQKEFHPGDISTI